MVIKGSVQASKNDYFKHFDKVFCKSVLERIFFNVSHPDKCYSSCSNNSKSSSSLPFEDDRSRFEKTNRSKMAKCGNSVNSSYDTLTIHVGEKFEAGKDKIFSFFPARRLKDMKNDRFGRPRLHIPKNCHISNLKNLKFGSRTGIKRLNDLSQEEIKKIWKCIVIQVFSQGFSLGTHLENLSEYKTLPSSLIYFN